MINDKKDRNGKIIVKWPVKVKKFNIKDPIMKMFVAKYESLIPWQEKVKNENDLKIYIERVMLKELFDQIDLKKFKKTNKGYFVTENDIGSDLVKNPDRLNLPENVILKAKEILKVDGFDRARSFITDEINKMKEKSLKSWRRRVKLAFPNEPHFWYLILKPLYDSSPKGSRRLVAGFNKRALEILYNRLKKEEFPPNKNILEAYFDSDVYTIGKQDRIQTGWVFVNSVNSLVRLSSYTSWCTKDYGYAEAYMCLERCDFFVLRCKGESEIALKVCGGVITVCVGKSDRTPSEKWYDDISMFAKTMYLEFGDAELKELMENHFKGLDFSSFSEEWWEKRIEIWPFSIKFAPKEIFEKYKHQAIKSALKYNKWKEFEDLFNETFGGVVNILDKHLWKNLIEIDPTYYNIAPLSIKRDPDLKRLCKEKWIEKLKIEGIPFKDHKDIPEHVYKDNLFIEAMKEKIESLSFSTVEFKFLPDSIWKNKKFTKLLKEKSPQALRRFMSFVRKYKKYYSQLNDFLAIDPPDPYYVAVDRLVSILLFEVKDVFYEEMVPKYLRLRNDYQKIRVEGWKKAINKNPFLFYVLPDDLKKMKDFENLFRCKKRGANKVFLWEIRSLYRCPWRFKYLSKEKKFDKRYWNACIGGYKRILGKYPYKFNRKIYVWGEDSMAVEEDEVLDRSSIVYYTTKARISPLILLDNRLMDTIINALVKRNKLHLDWKRLPEEFEELLTYQYAFLKAIYKLDKSRKDQEFYCNRSILKVYGEIRELFYERFNGDYPSSGLVNKVLKLIVILGVKYDYYLDPRFSSFRYCG